MNAVRNEQSKKRMAVKFALMSASFFLVVLSVGRFIVFWAATNTPLWSISVALFVQNICTAVVGAILFAILVKPRSNRWVRQWGLGLLVAVFAAATSAGIGLIADVWRGEWDWLSLFSLGIAALVCTIVAFENATTSATQKKA